MASTATTRLRLEKQAPGENFNAWGSKLNQSLIDLVDEAVAGVQAVTVSGSVALTATNYATDQARKAVLKVTGTGGTLTIPAAEKLYFVHNAATGALTITAGGTTAILSAGERDLIYCDGAAVYRSRVLDYRGDRLTNVGAPTDNADAATKAYVDAQIGALGLRAWAVKTASYTAAAGDRLLCDTSGGAFTVTLPPAPSPGNEVSLMDLRASWKTNPVTLARNGATIAGLAEDLTLDQPGFRVTAVYSGLTWAVG